MATPRKARRTGTSGHDLDLMRDADGCPTNAGDIARIAVINAILEGCTITAAAERAGVARTTASVWLNSEDDVKMMLAAGRHQLAQDHRAAIAKIHGKVLDRLEQALDNPATTTGEVVSIAKAMSGAFTATDEDNMNAERHFVAELEARKWQPLNLGLFGL